MLTQSIIKKMIYYNDRTGALTWRRRSIEHFYGECPERSCNMWNTKHAGNTIGSVRKQKRKGAGTKYIEVTLTVEGIRKSYFAHRLAWLYMTGETPNGVDHEDGDGLNNKWSNLRSVTNIENSKNSRLSKNNTSGFNGVYWHKRDKMWCAHIRIDGVLIRGGTFPDKGDAIECRKKLNIKYGFHKFHGLIKKGDYK